MKDTSNFQNLLFHGNTHVIERFSTSFPMHWHNYIEIISKPVNNKKENIHEAEISKEFALPDELENIEALAERYVPLVK